MKKKNALERKLLKGLREAAKAEVKNKKLRPIGDVYLDLERLHFELMFHGKQVGDVLSNFIQWAEIHAPDMFEQYTEDNTRPLYYYGHKDGLKTYCDTIFSQKTKKKID